MENELMEKERLSCMVGGLLYVPALKEGMAEKITAGRISALMSVAFCLEDAVADEAVERAETVLVQTMAELAQAEAKLPLIFVRVRNPEHLAHVHRILMPYGHILTGYVLPKFDLSNGAQYLAQAVKINAESRKKFYVMPTLETKAVADIATRAAELTALKELMDSYRELILNVRVGANDFCQLYGLRRTVTQTIYDIGVVRDILTDILNVFAADYVVSGAVWNCFGVGDGAWSRGLARELELDRANGFIGKTAIHPSQLPLIRRSLQVSAEDYSDAEQILSDEWQETGVKKSAAGGRMNEVKCHNRWARRVKLLGDIYGVRSSREDLLWLSTASILVYKSLDAIKTASEPICW